MAEGSGGDRTEAPTARRLQKAREDGQVALSREMVTLAMLVTGSLAFVFSWRSGVVPLTDTLRDFIVLSGRDDLGSGDLPATIGVLFREVASFAAPVLLATAAGAIVATLLQTGFLLRPAALLPDVERINPLRGLLRLADVTNAFEALKSVAKLGCFAVILFEVVQGAIPALAGSAARPMPSLPWLGASVILRAGATIVAVQLVIAVLDLLWTRYRHGQRLRMSKQDVREEQKENDGNPHVKARLRALRRQRARQQMIRAVPKAAVVLTNPTHYAVALAYEQGSRSAPRVVAKGADEVAARIRAIAAEHHVPVVENKPLARALFKVPLEAEIPREHFQAVAAVIAYVWRLSQRHNGGHGSRPTRQTNLSGRGTA